MKTDPETCPGCGMEKGQWRGPAGQGYQTDHGTYCCEGCATGKGCTCRKADASKNPKDAMRERSAEQMPDQGIEGMEELMGQQAGHTMVEETDRPTPPGENEKITDADYQRRSPGELDESNKKRQESEKQQA